MSETTHLAPTLAKGGVIFGNVTESFDPSPSIGDSCIKDGMLYVYLTYNAVTGWFPLIKLDKVYVHVQSTAGTVWEINHGMNSVNFVATVVVNNQVVAAETTIVDSNTVRVNVGVVTSGRVIFMFDVSDGGEITPSPYIVGGGVGADNRLTLTLSDSTEQVLDVTLNMSNVAPWVQVGLLNATSGTTYRTEFTLPKEDLLREVFAYKFIEGTDTNPSALYADFLATESGNFTTTSGVVIDDTVYTELTSELDTVPTTTGSDGGVVGTFSLDPTGFNELYTISAFKVG